MSRFTVGPFEVEVVTDGHPVWTRISYEGKDLGLIHHDELAHLHYAVERAVYEASRSKMIRPGEMMERDFTSLRRND